MVLVFAFSIGSVFAAASLNFFAKSNEYSTASYVAPQDHVIINDTTSNPIPFGPGAHPFEVAMQYSYPYNFDVRFKYSLSWSNGNSTDNVVLLYANRDGFIVDEEYIYYVGTKHDASFALEGTNKLPIFTGVEFVTVNEQDYTNATLTINIQEAKIYKAGAATYNQNHPLVSGMSAQPAAIAWLKYKGYNADAQNVNKAYAMVTNHRYKIANGIKYPNPKGAYFKSVSNNQVDSATWLGGNKYFAGISAYIVAGNSGVELRARITNSWTGSGGFAPDNNHLVNYSKNATDFANGSSNNGTTSNWAYDSATDSYYYTKIIPANTVAYVDVVDSIEITTLGPSASENTENQTINYNGYAIQTALELNGVGFSVSNSKLSCGYISSVDTPASAGHAQPEVSVYNSTVASPALYDAFEASHNSTYTSNITLINNTAKKMAVSNISYTLKLYASNGSPNADTWLIRTVECASGTYLGNIVGMSAGAYLAPYSSVTILESFSLAATLTNVITKTIQNGGFGGCYDVWVEVVPSYTASEANETTKSSTLTVEATKTVSASSTTVELWVKNKTKEMITGVSVTPKIQQLNKSFVPLASRPYDWNSSYWKYYTSSGQPNTSNDWGLATENPKGFRSITALWEDSSLANVSFASNFSANDNAYSNAQCSLAPNERVKVATITINTTNEIRISGSTATGTANADNSISLVNEGTSQAYIVNASANSYYVRFGGTLKTPGSSFVVSGQNYYIGIVRPGQVLAVPMTATGTMDTIVATGAYTSSTLSAWSVPNAVKTAFEAYFN